jgi:hypothetical protein
MRHRKVRPHRRDVPHRHQNPRRLQRRQQREPDEGVRVGGGAEGAQPEPRPRRQGGKRRFELATQRSVRADAHRTHIFPKEVDKLPRYPNTQK